MIKKLGNTEGVKLSSTLGGQRELLRQHRNKINEIIEHLESQHKACGGCDKCNQTGYSANKVKTYSAASSICCDSSFRTEGDTTKYYVCDSCNQPCDIKLTEKKIVSANTRDMGECDHELKDKCPCDNPNCFICWKCKVAIVKKPPQQERSEWEELGKQLDGVYLHSKKEADVANYIMANFISKERIKEVVNEMTWDYDGGTKWSKDFIKIRKAVLTDLMSSLGIKL